MRRAYCEEPSCPERDCRYILAACAAVLGVVIGAHCGPGLLTVFYLCNGRQPK